MAWPGVPSSSPFIQSQIMDMKMYEMTEHVRSMQIVQAEQSRRLDEQAYRIQQLELKDSQTSRFENQRYLWGPGAVGSTSSRSLPGLGFEVFPPIKGMTKEKVQEKEKEEKGEETEFSFEERASLNRKERTETSIEADIDNLLLSPSLTPREAHLDPSAEPESHAANHSSIAPPSPTTNYFPYILAVQCWLGGRQDRPPKSDADMIMAQINTAVHASFIDSALVHQLGVSHKIRNKRPTRYQMRFTGSPRPRILLPVYFPIDPSRAASAPESQVPKVHVDFVVVSTLDMPPNEHQRLASLEIGSQALFLHGIDILFSSRSLCIGGLRVPVPQLAPRDQKRLLSSIALATTHVVQTPQHSWDRLRRQKSEEHEPVWDTEQALLRDTSTNSSFSSNSAYQPTTALTSPAITENDPLKGRDAPSLEPEKAGLPASPHTETFSAALSFIPSSVVAKPSNSNVSDQNRSRNGDPTISPKSSFRLDRSKSRSNQSELTLPKCKPVDEDGTRSRSDSLHLENLPTPVDTITDGRLSPALELNPIPPRKSSLADPQQTPSRSSSLAEPTTPHDFPDFDLPRLPATLVDKVVQRKASSTWPRSLGKKVAPWTSVDATKTSILGTTFDQDIPPAPPRKMKILKPARSTYSPRTEGHINTTDSTTALECGDTPKTEIKDMARAESKETEEQAKNQLAAKNVGGGAFHWMK